MRCTCGWKNTFIIIIIIIQIATETDSTNALNTSIRSTIVFSCPFRTGALSCALYLRMEEYSTGYIFRASRQLCSSSAPRGEFDLLSSFPVRSNLQTLLLQMSLCRATAHKRHNRRRLLGHRKRTSRLRLTGRGHCICSILRFTNRPTDSLKR